MTEEEILNTLDHSNDGYYRSFVALEHGYSYLIDSRINVFCDNNNRWAIAIERLGYNPRAGVIMLDINYYGNCLTNLEFYNQRPINNYSVYPIDFDSFNETINGEGLLPNAKFWIVRGQQVAVSNNKQDYNDAGIELVEYEPNAIRAEEVGRLMVLQNSDLFRATDNELYKSIPTDLKKILVIDEWFHKDFQLLISPTMTDEYLRHTYEFNKNLTGLNGTTFESFVQTFRQQEILNNSFNREIWENNRPSTYETWQLIAKVIVTNDANYYKPTLPPNSHWSNWPESGNM